jgi:hypothetical protein
MKAIIGILILGVVGIGVFFFVNQEEDELTSEQTSDTIEESPIIQETEASQTGNIEDIKAMGDVVCEYQYNYDQNGFPGTSEGIIYHSGGKIRSNVNPMIEMGGSNSFSIDVILIDNIAYSWSDMGAFKMDLVKADEFNRNMKEKYGDMYITDETSVGMLKNDIDYSCKPWKADQSVFELPVGVEFVDFFKMMEGNMKQMEDMMGHFESVDRPTPQ